jgi:hypothetical protein
MGIDMLKDIIYNSTFPKRIVMLRNRYFCAEWLGPITSECEQPLNVWISSISSKSSWSDLLDALVVS